MKILLSLLVFLFIGTSPMLGQDVTPKDPYKKHGVVWTAGLFKSWLKDNSVGFNQIGNTVSPVFDEKKKMGFCIHSHYMYKPTKWLGIGPHLGMGLDVNSYISSPVVLFGISISLGNDHQFMINIGWADAKRKIVPGLIKDQLATTTFTEIPEIYNHTELNTGYYLGIGYRVF